MYLKNSENSQQNTCLGVSFLIKLRNWEPATSQKRESGAGAFLWISRTFLEHLFYETSPMAAAENKIWIEFSDWNIIVYTVYPNERCISKNNWIFNIKLFAFLKNWFECIWN